MSSSTSALVPYMVLEWLEGRSLAQEFEVRRQQGMRGRSMDEVLKLLDSAAQGLAFAHAQGVVHRDMNPGNLFLAQTRQGVTAKVLDFGVAKVISDHALEMGPRAQTLGQIRIFAPAYGSPEQFDDTVGKVGPASDVYSFALIVLEALRDQAVREGEHLGEFALMALDGNARITPRALGVPVGDAVEEVFQRAVAIRPGDRPTDMGQFWGSLKHAMREDAQSGKAPHADAVPFARGARGGLEAAAAGGRSSGGASSDGRHAGRADRGGLAPGERRAAGGGRESLADDARDGADAEQPAAVGLGQGGEPAHVDAHDGEPDPHAGAAGGEAGPRADLDAGDGVAVREEPGRAPLPRRRAGRVGRRHHDGHRRQLRVRRCSSPGRSRGARDGDHARRAVAVRVPSAITTTPSSPGSSELPTVVPPAPRSGSKTAKVAILVVVVLAIVGVAGFFAVPGDRLLRSLGRRPHRPRSEGYGERDPLGGARSACCRANGSAGRPRAHRDRADAVPVSRAVPPDSPRTTGGGRGSGGPRPRRPFRAGRRRSPRLPRRSPRRRFPRRSPRLCRPRRLAGSIRTRRARRSTSSTACSRAAGATGASPATARSTSRLPPTAAPTRRW